MAQGTRPKSALSSLSVSGNDPTDLSVSTEEVDQRLSFLESSYLTETKSAIFSDVQKSI